MFPAVSIDIFAVEDEKDAWWVSIVKILIEQPIKFFKKIFLLCFKSDFFKNVTDILLFDQKIASE